MCCLVIVNRSAQSLEIDVTYPLAKVELSELEDFLVLLGTSEESTMVWRLDPKRMDFLGKAVLACERHHLLPAIRHYAFRIHEGNTRSGLFQAASPILRLLTGRL